MALKTEPIAGGERVIRFVADATDSLLGYVDRKLIYRTANFALEEWFSPHTPRICGCTMESIHGEAEFALLSPFAGRALKGETVRFETMLSDRYGMPKRVRVRFTPEFDNDSNILGFAAVFEDLSDRESALQAREALNAGLEERVAERTKQLELANRELEAFSYSVSHDLRAPLRTISTLTQMLARDLDAHLGEEDKASMHQIVSASQRMSNLISDLLEYARLARAEPQIRRVDLTEIVESIIADLRSRCPSRAVITTVERGLIAEADPAMVRLALENLLENSWKFTSKLSSATIEVGVEESKDGRAFFVRDNGVGFDMTYVDKLFRPFERLHAEIEYPGTGIGLANVQRIVRRHGGKVWAQGSPGLGATFSFTLPGLAEPSKKKLNGPLIA